MVEQVRVIRIQEVVELEDQVVEVVEVAREEAKEIKIKTVPVLHPTLRSEGEPRKCKPEKIGKTMKFHTRRC